jgi:uncharacterized protein YukE
VGGYFVATLAGTSDPKELVPGSPEKVLETARRFTSYAEALILAGGGLKKINTEDGWKGKAADTFRDTFDGEPKRWITCGHAFEDAAQALTAYAETLRWAQGQAKEAVALWGQGQQATKQAEAEHEAQRQAAFQGAATHGIPLAVVDIPFNDPGEELRANAKNMLNRARRQLEEAGDKAERLIAKARDQAPKRLRVGSGDNSGDGPTGGSLGIHQALWCASVGLGECAQAMLLQQKALAKTNDLARDNDWSDSQTNAFRHSYWMGLMTLHGFTYDQAIALGLAHEKDTDHPDEQLGSPDSNTDLRNNEMGARLGVDIRPWYAVVFGFATRGQVRELEERLLEELKLPS